MHKGFGLLKKNISGWANTNFSHSEILIPKTITEIQEIIKISKEKGNKIIPRGGGCSYGDEALGEVVVDTTGMKKILEWNKNLGILRVQIGVTFEEVLVNCLEDSWILAVIPGTRYVTMGGALSNNIHGKNSYVKGNFGEWVKEFKIIIASGDHINCSRNENSDLFFATIGGAGLLGIVTEITIQLVRIPSPYLSVYKTTTNTLDKIIKTLEESAINNDFVIAQIDCFAKNKELGRGTIHSAYFIENNLALKNIEKIKHINSRIFGILPKKIIPILGRYFLNDYLMSMVSKLKYYLDSKTSTKKTEQDIFKFTFLLDQVPNWKRVFKNGFFEYEPLIPKDKALAVIRELIKITHKYNMPAYLSAIKIHKEDNFLLSYSMDGYSFAMDIPRNTRQKDVQDQMFREMNKIVINAGGIIYLAKDANLTKEEFRKMYKNIDRFMELKNKYDSGGLFESYMYKRIFK